MPKAVHLINAILDPSPLATVNAQTTGFSKFCTSLNIIAGNLAGFISNYDDINSFAYGYSSQEKFKVETVNLELLDATGNKIGMFLQSARHGVINANYNLQPADCFSVALPLDGVIATTQKLVVEERQSIRLYLNEQASYLGRIKNKPVIKRIDDNNFMYIYQLEGWKAYADDIIVYPDKTYEYIELSDIVKELAQDLANKTPINYNVEKISKVDYRVEKFKTTGSILSSLNNLQTLAGAWVWGVDVYGDFYFREKRIDVLHHLWEDKDAIEIQNLQYNATQIKNHLLLRYKPEEGPIQTRVVEDAASIAQYGRIEKILDVESTPFTTRQEGSVLSFNLSSNSTLIDAALITDGEPYTVGKIKPYSVGDYLQIDLINLEPETEIYRISLQNGNNNILVDDYSGHYRGAVNHLKVVALPSLDVVAEENRQDSYDLYYLFFNEPRKGDTGYRIIGLKEPNKLISDWRNNQKVFFYNYLPNITGITSTQATSTITPDFDCQINYIDWNIRTTAAAPNDTHSITINGVTVSINTGGIAKVYRFNFNSLNLTGGTTYNVIFERDLDTVWELPTLRDADSYIMTMGQNCLINGVTEIHNPDIVEIGCDVNYSKSDGWEIGSIEIHKRTANDATRYGESYLQINAQPFIEGAIVLEQDYFYIPASVRLTDATGQTVDNLYADVYNVVIENGIKTSMKIGNRRMYLEKLVAKEKG